MKKIGFQSDVGVLCSHMDQTKNFKKQKQSDEQLAAGLNI